MHYLPSEIYHCALITRVNKCSIVFRAFEWKSLHFNSSRLLQLHSTVNSSSFRSHRVERPLLQLLVDCFSFIRETTAPSIRGDRVGSFNSTPFECFSFFDCNCIISSKPSSRGASLHLNSRSHHLFEAFESWSFTSLPVDSISFLRESARVKPSKTFEWKQSFSNISTALFEQSSRHPSNAEPSVSQLSRQLHPCPGFLEETTPVRSKTRSIIIILEQVVALFSLHSALATRHLFKLLNNKQIDLCHPTDPSELQA